MLLVEDDEMFRGLLGEVLRGAGYEVMVAPEPATALALLADRAGAPTCCSPTW